MSGAVTTWPHDRAVRNLDGTYPEDQRGKVADTGDMLDTRWAGVALSTAWWAPEGCFHCFPPQFLRFIPHHARKCPEHGWPKLPPEDPYPMSAEERRLADRRARRPIAERWRIPSRYWYASLEYDDQTAAVKAVKRFLQADDAEHPGCLILAGGTGSGKTHAAVAGFFHRAVRWRGAVFYEARTLARKFLSDEADAVLEECIEAELLVVDDVGSEYRKEGGLVEAFIEELVIAREAGPSEHETIVTTNMTVTKFAAAMGDRIADRIAGSWAEWVSLPGTSLRRKRRK